MIDTQALKNKVLALALQGKLTKQLLEDGTADELYAEIQKEKSELIDRGIISKEKNLPIIDKNDYPYDIPDNWRWVRWGDISNKIQYGYNAPAKPSGRIKMVRISDIQNNCVQWETVPFCDIDEVEIDNYLLLPNDILFARTGGTVGKSYIVEIVPEKAVFAGYLIRTNYSELLCPKYLKYFMESRLYWKQLSDGTTATAQPNCNGKKLSMMMVPLPPAEEQKRIVSLIDNAFSLIDIIETNQEFYETNKESLKAAIIDLGIKGKLTEQLSEDGVADSYFEYIQQEKHRVIKEKNIKKDKLANPIEKEEIPFEIHKNWRFVRLGEIFIHSAGKALNSAQNDGTEYEYITTSNLYWDRFDLDNLKKMRFIDSEIEKCTARYGDLLVCEGGDIGRSAIWDKPYEIKIQNHIHRLRPIAGINARYFYYVMWLYKKNGRIDGRGIGLQGLSANRLKSLVVPLPPVNEQSRIVARIDELLQLCE